MEIVLILIVGALNIACFLIGAKVGQQVSKGEPVELPKIEPLKAIQEHREKKAAEKEQERIDAILQNIETYDGTAAGQKDIPEGR